MLIQADGDVWRKPSWLVAWGELPESEEIEVLRTNDQTLQLTVAVTDLDPPLGRLQPDRADLQGRAGLGHPLRAAQHRGNPGHQLAGRERLGDVVIGPELQPTIVGRVWACEWIGQGEPVTVQYDDGFPQTVRIDRPEFL